MSAAAIRRRWEVIGLAALSLAAAGWSLMPSARQSALQWIDEVCSAAGRPMFASMPTIPGAPAVPGHPATSVRVLSCEPLPDAPGKNLTTMVVDFPPLARSAPHRHPGSVTAFVISGHLRSQLQGGPVVDYSAGQSWFEAPRILHMLAENPDPARAASLLAVFVTDENCGPLVIPEPPASP